MTPDHSPMRHLLLGFLAALLPAPERGRFANRWGIDPAGPSAFLGLLEFLIGGPVVLANALAFLDAMAKRNAALFVNILENRRLTDAEKVSYGLSGVSNWVQWVTQPWVWVLISIPIVGLVRMVAWGVNHEASGEPIVWAGLRIWQAIQRKLGESRERLRFGPDRPDRLVFAGGLTVLSNRLKAEWNPRIAIEIDGRFYRLLSVEERQDGAWWVYAHVLGEFPDNEVIRGLVRYEAKK